MTFDLKATRAEARRDLFGYIEGLYDTRRLHSALATSAQKTWSAERLNPVHFAGARSVQR
jgi:transposase InsO family protein